MRTTSEAWMRREAAERDSSPLPGVGGEVRPATMHRSRHFRARLHRRIEDIRPVYAALQSSGHLTVYQRLDWLDAMTTHLATASARVLVVEVVCGIAGAPVMLLPFTVTRRLGVTVAGSLDFGVCDYAAPVLASGVTLSPDEAAEAWAAVLAVLTGVDLVDIRQIPPDIHGARNPLILLDHCSETALQAFGVALDGDPKTVMRRLLGSKGHRSMARRESKLAERGELRLVEPSSAAEIETLFATLVEQRRRRFRDIGRQEILDRPQIEAFYRDVALRSLDQNGPARLFGMAVGDHIVAATYMLVHRGSMHGLLLSIGGPEWHAGSPGLVMVAKMIEWAASHGLSYFDMTVGDLPYKSGFGAKPRVLHRLLQPRTIVGSWAAAVLMRSARAADWVKGHPRLHQSLRSMRQRARRLSGFRPSLGR